MPRISLVDPAESEGVSREVFERLLKERGKIPNLMRTVAHRPEHLRALVDHMRAVMRSGTVPPFLKELIAIRISRIQACEYTLASHVALAKQMGATEGQIAALLDVTGPGEAEVGGFPEDCLGTAPTRPPIGVGLTADTPFTSPERAALLFAERMTIGSGRIQEAEFRALSDHFDRGQIVEIALVVGLFNGLTRICNSLEIDVTP